MLSVRSARRRSQRRSSNQTPHPQQSKGKPKEPNQIELLVDDTVNELMVCRSLGERWSDWPAYRDDISPEYLMILILALEYDLGTGKNPLSVMSILLRGN